MSNARKLQTEIDRVMKKIDEGVELFDEIWEKVYSAEQQNQKEKYEMDLKKEIKKLQRLRDQVKSWISSSEVKDKDSLIDARKLIETKMEAFKVIEKETKTKTYSKEGLARAERLSPEDEAKIKSTAWISEIIEQLNQLVEDRDVEIARLSAGKGKKSNKGQIEEFNEFIMNHKYHISKLEGIMRLVNNDLLQPEIVDDIREDLEYYLEAYEDEDYMQGYDEEMFYESLGLDELDVVNVDTVTQPTSTTKNKDENDADSASARSTGTGKSGRSKKTASSLNVIPLTIGRARITSDKTDKGTPTKIGRSSSDTSSVVSISRKEAPTTTVVQSTPSVPAPAKVAAPPAGASMAAILKREGEQQEKDRQAKALQMEQQRKQQLREQARLQAEQLRQQQQEQQRQEAIRQQQQQQAKQEAAQREALKRQQLEQARQEEALKLQQIRVAKEPVMSSISQQSVPPVQQPNQHSLGLQGSGHVDGLPQGLLGGLSLGSNDANIPLDEGNSNVHSILNVKQVEPLLSTPLGGSIDSVSLGGLDDSFRHLPSPLDSERQRTYVPRSPYPTHSSFPTVPAQLFDNPVMYEKLGTDCLFFIFYYSQGTYQQYLAARELKKQSWRFHKKYMTWFQRHEEPKITTDEYEQGTYVYFDFETGWCQRLKQDFRFEYSYLEDSLIV